MKRFFSKKSVVIGTTLGLILGGSLAAIAYFTNGGTGNGTAKVGSTTLPFKVNVATTPGAPDLLPSRTTDINQTIDTVSVTVINQDEAREAVSVVKVKVNPTFDIAVAGHPDCTPADFSVGGAAVGTEANLGIPVTDLPPSSDLGQATFTTSLEMIDNGLDQDNCEGVTVPLIATAS